MAKLNKKQAQEVIVLSTKMIKKCAELRLGQAIMNACCELYPEVENHFHLTDHDFFYWRDEHRVMSCFNKHWVGE